MWYAIGHEGDCNTLRNRPRRGCTIAPRRATDMATIKVKTETDSKRSWTFTVEVDDGGRRYDYTVTLSWSDYDHWSHGRIAPEKVIRAAFEFLLEREPASQILSEFDCAVIRRYFPDIDHDLPKRL